MLPNVRSLRKKKGISQAALAAAIGVSQQSINKYENHNIEPDISALVKMANYFNTTIDYIVGQTSIPLRLSDTEPFHISPEEIDMINMHRHLSNCRKQAVLAVIQSYFDNTEDS